MLCLSMLYRHTTFGLSILRRKNQQTQFEVETPFKLWELLPEK